MVNNVFGPHAEFKEAMYQAYQPMFELVGKEIIGIGMSQGIFRRVDPASTARLVMNIYLGTASRLMKKGNLGYKRVKLRILWSVRFVIRSSIDGSLMPIAWDRYGLQP